MRLTQTGVGKIASDGKPFWVTDEGCPNLRLYVGASGSKTWYAQYRDEYGKHQSRKLGPADALTVAQARETALDVAARVVRGEDVKRPKPKKRSSYAVRSRGRPLYPVGSSKPEKRRGNGPNAAYRFCGPLSCGSREADGSRHRGVALRMPVPSLQGGNNQSNADGLEGHAQLGG
jgi:hypothetical protein